MSDAPPLPRRGPDRMPRWADRLLPPLAAVAAAALCLFLWVPAESQLPRGPAFFGGWLAGVLLPRLYRSRWRMLGLAPYGATAAAITAAVSGSPDGWPGWLVALFCGFAGVAVGAVLRYRDNFRAQMWHLVFSALVGAAIGAAVVAWFVSAGPAEPAVRETYRWLLVALTLLTAVQAWVTLPRAALEVAAEPVLELMYRVRVAGPGRDEFPMTGPVLVIANHAAWFDPLILAKVLPRVTTPMMTESFYNIWFLKPILKHVARVIVVPEKPVRRAGAPEVREAIAALDAGLCVLIFPEGYLRRKEEQALRRFGQGVWQILSARPATPVVASWIEGMWGSYTSHQGGPPTAGKKFDLFRRVGIGISAPELVPAEVLADQMATRLYLMDRVLEARKHLGLAPLPPGSVPAKDADG